MLNKQYQKEYYMENKEKITERNHNQVRNEYGSFAKRAAIRRQENLRSWEGFIPAVAQCQICGKNIYFHRKNRADAIHFDHRHNGSEDIKKPFSWLCGHKRSKRNEVIWTACDFGMLCSKCNLHIPTKNREEYTKNLWQYVFNDEVNNAG